ncbi:hypothetical protein Tco_1321815 [Tanacetum coccineum]
MVDYALWEVIENGATLPRSGIVEGVITVLPITSAEDKALRRLEVKSRSTLMIGIPNEPQLKFNSIKDAKLLLEAIEKKFGRNAATKMTKRNLLKKQYENFSASSLEILDQTFDRLQKLLLRSLSLEWNTHTVMWRNKPDLETISMDDLYKNLKVYEPKVKGMSNSSSSIKNMDFVSSNSPSSTNAVVNTTYEVSTDSTQDDLEEMDLKWKMAMLTMRAKRFLKNTERKLTLNNNETSFKKSRQMNKESTRRTILVETLNLEALVSCDGLGYDWSDQAEEGPTNYALMAYSSSSSDFEVSKDSTCSKSCLKIVELLKSQNEQLSTDLKKSELLALSYKLVDNCKKGLGYNSVPPPYTGKFLPPKLEFSFIGINESVNEPVVENLKANSSEEEPKIVRKNDGASIIKD